MHAINNMLQGQQVNEVQLAEIGRGFDAAERRAMAAAGTDSAEYLAFMAAESNNVRQTAEPPTLLCVVSWVGRCG